MKYFVQSEWFALVSGLASVLGMLLALYQLRVRFRPHSRIRTMEWQKALLISLGIGIITASGLRFYFQSPPPGFVPVRKVYDLIHGTEGSVWADQMYHCTGAGFERANNYIELTEIYFFSEFTRAIFHITPMQGTKNPADFDPLPSPVLGTSRGIKLNSINKSFTQQGANNTLIGYVDFPPLENVQGNIYIWDQAYLADNANSSAPISLHNDHRGEGTSLWGLLVCAGIGITYIGFKQNPFDTYKKQLINEGKDLQTEQYKELDKILNGRAYEDLSTQEKQKYDQTSKFYTKAQDAIFRTLTGEHDKESN